MQQTTNGTLGGKPSSPADSPRENPPAPGLASLPNADLHGALRAVSNGIVIADATTDEYPLIYVNPGFERMTGYSASEVMGRNCRFLQGSKTDRAAVHAMGEALRAGRDCRMTLLNERKDGTPFWNEVFLSPVVEDGQVVRYIGVQHDVTERRAAEERVAYLAFHDALTGLANRRRVSELLDEALGRARRTGNAVALMYLDFDDFKSVNDSYGHTAGDRLLCLVAQRLESIVRASETLARQGGDEFLILLADIAEEGEEATRAVAARVSAALAEPFDLDDAAVTLGASIGVSIFPRDAGDAAALLKHADDAMYAAKAAGRGRATIYGQEAGRAESFSRRTDRASAPAPAGDLESILATGGISPVYQPIVDLHTGAVLGYEALARGPAGSALERPDRLFESARRLGRLSELDRACRVAALRVALKGGLRAPTSLFLNVEPETFRDVSADDARELWSHSALEGNVVLEITERALTSSPAALLAAVERARALGFGIALDDIGADTRSLALMPLLAPDVLKLDLRLVQEQPSEEIAAIVNAVAAHCQATGAKVIAEGIETQAHLDTAIAMGADLGQGWLFGRPGRLPDTPAWIPAGMGRADHREPAEGATPFEVVAGLAPTREATKPLLIAMSLHLEQLATTLGSGAVVMSAFQTAERFTPLTRVRYQRLAERAALVAALGIGLEPEPAHGVRGATLESDDPLADEWSVAVIGHHFAGALVARDLGDEGPEAERRFEFALCYDRLSVIEAAATLVRRVRPEAAAAGPA